jgi:hypothetical protein
MQLGPGKRGWKSPHGNWKKTLAPYLRSHKFKWDLYERIPNQPGDGRLILQTISTRSSRALLETFKRFKGPISATMHLSPQTKANKALAYRKCERKLTKIDDRGDVLFVSSRLEPDLK